jgi:hypothetical protein
MQKQTRVVSNRKSWRCMKKRSARYYADLIFSER